MITQNTILFFLVISLIVFNYVTWKRLKFTERHTAQHCHDLANIRMVITNNNGFTETEKQQLNS